MPGPLALRRSQSQSRIADDSGDDSATRPVLSTQRYRPPARTALTFAALRHHDLAKALLVETAISKFCFDIFRGNQFPEVIPQNKIASDALRWAAKSHRSVRLRQSELDDLAKMVRRPLPLDFNNKSFVFLSR